MDTIVQIQHALERLSIGEREVISDWLQKLTEAQLPGSTVAEPRSSYAVVQPPFMTVDEYMEFEERSPIRHEYVNGAIYAMNGPSLAHARIARELVIAVAGHLRGKPCEVFSTDVKLLIWSDTGEIYYYPDIVVACEREHWGPPPKFGRICASFERAVRRRYCKLLNVGWRCGRAVEGTSLENWQRGNPFVSSNLTASEFSAAPRRTA